MIVFLDGKLVEKMPTRIVLDVGGVGYEVLIPLSSYDALPAPGHPCRVLTYDLVREDDHLLYGFVTVAEREMFERLMSVNGIGPRLALSALSGLSVRELKRAVAAGDVKRLSSVSGIGRKTAERMIVELRDKIGPAEALEAASAEHALSEQDLLVRDAVLALISLGYKRAEAQNLIQKVGGAETRGGTVEEIIRKALAG